MTLSPCANQNKHSEGEQTIVLAIVLNSFVGQVGQEYFLHFCTCSGQALASTTECFYPDTSESEKPSGFFSDSNTTPLDQCFQTLLKGQKTNRPAFNRPEWRSKSNQLKDFLVSKIFRNDSVLSPLFFSGTIFLIPGRFAKKKSLGNPQAILAMLPDATKLSTVRLAPELLGTRQNLQSRVSFSVG